MAFVDKSNTKKIYAYLTKIGREKILTGDTTDFIITDFSLHDDDVNYYIAANKVNSEYNVLPSGFIPDITGDNQDCTISISEQFLKNEIFGDANVNTYIPITGCGDPTATNYNSNLNTSIGDVIDNSLCIYPPPQPLDLTNIIGQCATEPFKFVISANDIQGGTQPYQWYVETSFGNNNAAPYNTLRNEGDSFIFDIPTNASNPTITVKVRDNSNPQQTAEKLFTNVSCTPTTPFIKISAYCETNYVLNKDYVGSTTVKVDENRPVWGYKIQIEYVYPQKPWKYIIISKGLSLNNPIDIYSYTTMDETTWQTTITRPYTVPGTLSDSFGNLERRFDFNNTTNQFKTHTIELPGNVGKPIDFQLIFYDTSITNMAQQVANRVTAFTVTDVMCAPRKIRLKLIKSTKPMAVTSVLVDGIKEDGMTIPGQIIKYLDHDVRFNEGYLPNSANWFDIFAHCAYVDPDIATTRIMGFERYTQDYGIYYVPEPPATYNSYINDPNQKKYRRDTPDKFWPLEIAIPFYIAYDDLANDYADIYLFDKSHIPTDFTVQFKTVGTFNKDRIKFPSIGNPKVDWIEDSSGNMVSPEYNLTDAFIEEVSAWTYNNRAQPPIFRRFNYETSPNVSDGSGMYYLMYPGLKDGCEGFVTNPGNAGYFGTYNDCSENFGNTDPFTDNLEPVPKPDFNVLFRGQTPLINQSDYQNATITDLGSRYNNNWSERPRECIVYRYILPIRFNPKDNPGSQPETVKTLLDLEIEMICNHPSLSTVNYYNHARETPSELRNYSSNNYKIQLQVPTRLV